MDKLFKIPSLEDFKTVTDEIISNLYNLDNHPNILQEDDIKLAKEDIRRCLLETNFDMDRLTTLLESQQCNENKVSYFLSSLKERKSDLLLSMFIHFNSAFGETVQEFNWLVKLVLGTSELKTVRYPLLQLIMLTVTKTGNKDKKVFDIKKDMLDKMIDVIEVALNT
ncbi:unnamed protein product [Parnassius apollo]|uniref:(apollo) hypothetical protein n=1 Tax=Parnassius apollo TaxID=110799 RepID=A0A8S3WP11_PARAO|nr:unnamed protein product [Parnassius apollo]